MTNGKGSTELSAVERLFAEFISSNIGLAVIDRQMRYRALNAFLAASNGTSVESHLGKHLREILGGVAIQVEATIEQVFTTARPVSNCELSGPLPTKPDGGHWIDSFFPITDSTGTVKQVGAVVVELPLNLKFQLTDPQIALPSPVLRSWKDIAQYVGACVKTVQRWEHAHNFPIQRLNPHKGAVVFALKDEVDNWLRNSCRECEPTKRDLASTAVIDCPFSVGPASIHHLIGKTTFAADWIKGKTTKQTKPRSS